jgi:hypothetical protein
MVLRTITGARTPVCLSTAIASVEAVTPPSWRRQTGVPRQARFWLAGVGDRSVSRG